MSYKTYEGKTVGRTLLFAEDADGNPAPVKVSDLGGGGGSVTWANIEDKPSTFPPSSHNHDELYYSKQEVDDLISNLQSQIDDLGGGNGEG